MCCLPDVEQIDERCRDMLIKYETAQIAGSDLDRYYKALDTVCELCSIACCVAC